MGPYSAAEDMIKDRWGDRSGARRQTGGGGGKARAMRFTAITRPALAAVVEARGAGP